MIALGGIESDETEDGIMRNYEAGA